MAIATIVRETTIVPNIVAAKFFVHNGKIVRKIN
ncbi:MAG: ribosomal protein S19 family protein [Dysgonamonadaceae bacterium]|nr:ribosomal protein S19 family protein [Dysgonamonadaceae bacterium]